MDVPAVDALLARAREQAGRGDLRGARAALDRAVALQPGSARVRLARAVILVHRDLAAARADVASAVELGGGAPALAVRGWLALHADADAAAAERDLSAAIEGGDRRASTYLARGWARDALGDHTGAFADAARAAAFAPVDPDARFLIGVCRIRLGDPGGEDDLDRAEDLYAAAGDQRGRSDVWDLRRAIREGRTPVLPGPGPWLWFGPRADPVDSEEGHGPAPPYRSPAAAARPGAARPGAARPGAARARRSGRVLEVPGGHVTLLAVVAVIRYLATAAVLAALTMVLPGPAAGDPVVLTLLALPLCYRLLHTGAVALLDSLRRVVPVPVAAVRWLLVGAASAVALVRWAGAALLSALLFAVSAWVLRWVGLDYRTGGVRAALVVGAVLGLGVFVSAPVLRRSGESSDR